MKVLIVRLGALGDIVHAVPAAAALRAAHPDARDRLARRRAPPRDPRHGDGHRPRHRAGESQHLGMDRRHAAAARRVAMTSRWTCRGCSSRRSSRAPPVRRACSGSRSSICARRPRVRSIRSPSTPRGATSSARTCGCCEAIGIHDREVRFPLANVDSRRWPPYWRRLRAHPIALLNPGAAWPNKRWPTPLFGEVASFLRDVRGFRAVRSLGPRGGRARALRRRMLVGCGNAGPGRRRSPTSLRCRASRC